MNLVDQFMAFVHELVESHMAKLPLTDLEKLGIKVSIYDIFDRNYDINEIMVELSDYLKCEADLKNLVPKITSHFNNLEY